VRDNPGSGTKRLNTNNGIVSDALADGGADMPNLVAVAAHDGSRRGRDPGNDSA